MLSNSELENTIFDTLENTVQFFGKIALRLFAILFFVLIVGVVSMTMPLLVKVAALLFLIALQLPTVISIFEI